MRGVKRKIRGYNFPRVRNLPIPGRAGWRAFHFDHNRTLQIRGIDSYALNDTNNFIECVYCY